MVSKGELIEYIEHGKFICAFVMENTGKKLHLLNQNGREVSLSASRVVCRSKGIYATDRPRSELQQELVATNELRQSLMREVDLAEIWHLASEEEGAAFDVAFLAELGFGEDLTDNHVAAFLRCIFSDKLYFKYREGRIVAHSPDTVEQLKIKQEKEKEQEALMQTGARNIKLIWEGKDPGDWPERDRSFELVRDYYLFGNDADDSALARNMLRKAGLNRPHDPYKLLVRAGIWQRHENIPLLRYEIPREFSDEAVRQTASLREADYESLVAAGRRDLTHLPLLTIDGAETRDHDDALHIEKRGDNFLVGIHIADVSYYVKQGDPLFKEAEKRITSIYFPDEQIPMLPDRLCTDLCSLVEGKVRPAVSFLLLLDKYGTLLEQEVVASIVKVKRKLIYEEVDTYYEADEELRDLALLSRKLQQKRIESGALILPIPELHIRADAAGQVHVKIAEVDRPARMLVAEMMVLANSVGAQLLAERDIPGLFRSQPPPHKKMIEQPEKDLFINFKQRKFLAPGNLSPAVGPHSGVGVSYYSTMTSPIRRFLDLIMQHQLLELATGRRRFYSPDQLNGWSGAIGVTQSRVNLVRQLRQRYWIIQHIKQRQAKRLEGFILNRGPKRIQVVLYDYLMEVELPASQGMRARPGDRVAVKVARADGLENILRFEW